MLAGGFPAVPESLLDTMESSPNSPASAGDPEIDELFASVREIRAQLGKPPRAPVYLGSGLLYLPTRLGYSLVGFSDDLQITASLLERQEWEPAITKFCLSHVWLGMRVVEIGANIGYFSVLFSNLVGFGGRVQVFEPNPRTVDILRRNVRMNNIGHVCQVFPVALSDREGTAEFSTFQHNQACSTLSTIPEHLLAEWHEQPSSITVPTKRLDDIISADDRPVDFMKIDAEGAELLIWRGGDRFFRQNTHAHTTIVMEFNPPSLAGMGADPRALLELVRAHGFRIWSFGPDGQLREEADNSAISLSVNTDLVLCRQTL